MCSQSLQIQAGTCLRSQSFTKRAISAATTLSSTVLLSVVAALIARFVKL